MIQINHIFMLTPPYWKNKVKLNYSNHDFDRDDHERSL